MGVDYFASVVFGVAYTSKRITTSVTRYSELTGKPYQKPMVERELVPVKHDIAATFPEPQDNFELDEWYDELSHGGEDGGVIGVCVKRVSPEYSEAVPLDIPDQEELETTLREKLKRHYTPQEVAWFMTHARLHLCGYSF